LTLQITHHRLIKALDSLSLNCFMALVLKNLRLLSFVDPNCNVSLEKTTWTQRLHQQF